MSTLQELKKTLHVRRGKRTRYYIEIEVDNEKHGLGFDDAHFWDALNDLDDKSYYEDAELTAVEKIVNCYQL